MLQQQPDHNYAVLTDRKLLERFQRYRDQQAFTELVQRHHTLVLGLCRQLLGSTHDAEDAYQATFLVLVRNSSKIRNRDALGGWLYGVAYRIATRIRQRRSRWSSSNREEPAMSTSDPLAEVAVQDQLSTTHAAISQLPESLRLPLVMRYLNGMSNREVAARLSLSEAAIEGRLKRAKARLRVRLARQGLMLSAALATVARQRVAAAADAGLIEHTIRLCGADAPSIDVAPDSIYSLVQEEIKAMLTTQFTRLVIGCSFVVVAIAASTAPRFMPRAVAGQDPFDEFQPKVSVANAPAQHPEVEVTLSQTTDPTVPPADTPADALLRATDQSRARILNALAQPASVDFFDEPLGDVVSYLAERHGIQIVFDVQALDTYGVSTDAPISCAVHNVSLQSALNIVLRQVGLVHIIRDEVLTITTPDVAETMVETRVYAVSRHWPITSKELTSAITTCVVPSSWDVTGGDGSLVQFDGGLIVTQTMAVHAKVARLLEDLEAHSKSLPE